MAVINKDVLKHNALLNYDLLLEYLNIRKYNEIGNQIRSACPCHNGDNQSAFVFYLDTGHWCCYTNHCHKEFGSDIIGLIRTIVRCTYDEALKKLNSILANETIIQVRRKKNVRVDYITQHLTQPRVGKRILSRLEKNYLYVMRRGMDAGIFRQWGCGVAKSGKMRGRFVIPIRDLNGDIVGFSGRNLTNSDKYPKWLHSKFRKSLNLFGIDEVSGKSVVLVEGPFDVVKGKMSGINNVCATLGTALNQGQIELLKYLKINKVYLSMDGDQAGKNASKDMKDKLLYNKMKCINMEIDRDFGDMSCDDIRRIYEKTEVIRS